MASLNNRKINLERKLQDIQEDKGSLERRISEMEVILTDRLGQMDNLKEKMTGAKSGLPVEEKKESVELPAIVVKPQAEVPGEQRESGATLMGRIMAINKENNFVIIDLGSESKVKAGDTFRVYRGDKPIANIEVIQVRQSISACDIKRQGLQIKIGDIVR